jgi:acetyltransferase-like isoleucine patch superfamily enzyme
MGLLKRILRLPKALSLRIQQQMDPVGHARRIGVRVGRGCRLIQVNFGSEPYLVTLGDRVSATCTSFVTHDGSMWVFRKQHPNVDIIAPIVVGSNVFLGMNTIILPGVTIGDNVIVGAGAIVTKSLPSNCVAAGAPAKPLRSLDEYWEKIQPRIIPTGGLPAEEKARICKAHFLDGKDLDDLLPD